MPELPNGFDRADGIAGRIGTPTPSDAIKVQSYNGSNSIEDFQIEEDPESPEIERAEQSTICHRFTMPWEEAVNQLQLYGRGTVLEDSFGDQTRVLSAKIKRKKGGYAEMEIISESRNFDPPPDQFSIVPVELGVNILKHPRYFYALQGSDANEEVLNQMVIRRLQDYFENPNAQMRDSITAQIWASLTFPGTVVGGKAVSEGETLADVGDGPEPIDTITGTEMAKRAALEIIQKYWRGEETPYVVGYQITWSSFYYRPPYLNPGGYVENPASADCYPYPIPNYFLSPSEMFNTSETTIFDDLAYINPQCYSVSGESGGDVRISWMRKADQIDEQRMWFRVDRTWIGSPVGFWDEQLYNASSRPASPGDYQQISPSKNPEITTT